MAVWQGPALLVYNDALFSPGRLLLYLVRRSLLASRLVAAKPCAP